MNAPLLFNLESSTSLCSELQTQLGTDSGLLTLRQFPDGETYLRVLNDCENRAAIIFCNLHHPDEKLLRLLFLAANLRELGATSVGLITPYLAYMRQDKRFKPGECVTSRHFARLLSSELDWLVTVDPHLHRYHSLDQLYSLSSTVVHAAPAIARWIQQQVAKPLLIGPDSESEQWVSQVAELAGAPFRVLSKIRHGDYDVEVSSPELARWQQHTPILVDDIISSGQTMLETINHIRAAQLAKPICIGVHGLFSDDTHQQLTQVSDLVTCNTISHDSNQINLATPLAEAAKQFL